MQSLATVGVHLPGVVRSYQIKLGIPFYLKDKISSG
jgi:hypothetical protein